MRKCKEMGTNMQAKVFQEIVCGRKGVVGKEDANVFLNCCGANRDGSKKHTLGQVPHVSTGMDELVKAWAARGLRQSSVSSTPLQLA